MDHTEPRKPQQSDSESMPEQQPTRWSRIHDQDYDYVALRFWSPVYRFLRNRLSKHEDAEEIAQEVFLRFMEKNLLDRADQERGSFRTFLFHVVRQILIDHYRSRSAAKRDQDRNVPLSSVAFETSDQGMTPEEIFDCEWYLSVISRARKQTAEHYAQTDRAETYRAFDLFYFSSDRPDRPSHQEIAETCGLSMTQVRNAIHRTKAAFHKSLRSAIEEYTDSEEELQAELADLAKMLDRNMLRGLQPGDLLQSEPESEEPEG